MKREELRVGNLVEDQKGQIREVKCIDSNNEDCLYLKIPTCSLAIGRHSLKDICPINIDEDILIKCGLKRIVDGLFYGFKSSVGYVVPYQNGAYGLYQYVKSDEYIARFTYLHELQNLYYALTKEELDVSKLLK